MGSLYTRSRDALKAADPVAELPKGEARQLMGKLGQHTYQQLDNIFYGVDTPGATARAGLHELITGRPAGPVSGNWDDRVEGAEILDDLGITNRRPTTTLGKVARTVGGVGVEILTDPLSILSGPMKAFTQAGRAADAAGILKHASTAASTTASTLNAARAMAAGGQVANDLPAVGRMAVRAMTKAGVPITEATVSARPLVGQRLAMRQSNLRSLLDAVPQSDRQRALDSVNEFLRKEGTTFQHVENLPLAKSIGLGLPLGDAAASFDVFGKKGGDLLAGAMDAVGHAAGWSLPGRLAGAAFQNKVNGTIGVGDQIQAIRTNQLRDAAERVANRASAGQVAKTMLHNVQPGMLPNGVKKLFSQEGNDAILKLMEKEPQFWDAADNALYHGDSMTKEIVDNWDTSRKWFLDESERLGLDSHKLADPYKTQYVPRQLSPMHLLEGGGVNDFQRGDAFAVPGGTTTLRQLSIDPQIAGLGRTLLTDDLAADHIMTRMGQLHPGVTYTRDHAIELARALRNIPDETVAKKLPWFADHPLESISKYMVAKHKAFATAQSKVEALADFAAEAHRQIPYTQVQKGGHVSASDALSAVGLKSTMDATGNIINGGGMRLKEEIAKRLGNGATAASVDLSKISVPQDLVQRLNRAMDIYQSPQLQSQIAGYLDQFAKIWKAGQLTWPARYVRDLYSGFVSNLIETGDGLGCINAAVASRYLVAGEYDKFAGYLATIPRYKAMARGSPQAALEEFLTDMGSTGIFSSSVVQDLATANKHGSTAMSSIPGANPLSVSGALGALLPDSKRNWGDWLTVKGTGIKRTAVETKNPWFQAGEHLSEYTDSLNRMTGMLTLMQNNIDPMAAADRIRRAQVDYGSLTVFERNMMTKVLFPFWAYQSRMGHYVVNEILSRPGGRYAQMIRGLHDAQNLEPDQYVPTNIREQFGYRLSGDERGDTFLTDLDLPGIDILNTIKPGGTQPVSLRRTAESVVQMGNPLARATAELLTGENMFHKKPLHEVESGLDRALMALGGSKTPYGVNTLLSVMPVVPRLDSVLRAATEKDRAPGEKAWDISINNLTGVKRRFVPKTVQLKDATGKIRDELHEQGRVSENWYVPEDDIERLTPEQLRLYQLYKLINKHNRSTNKARKEGQPLPALPF